MKIYGAGLAGLLAGCHFQRATIYEAGDKLNQSHKAVLRFRSNEVGESVGIDFDKVKVHKGIWDGDFVEPNIRYANWYSEKVIGRLADRSIWNLETVERFIAPEDFLLELAEKCEGRVKWNHKVTPEEMKDSSVPAISTIPMMVTGEMLGIKQVALHWPEFNSAPIVVERFRIKDANVYQTIYYPSPATSLYRASITKDLLIAEYIDEPDEYNFFQSFGISRNDCVKIEKSNQRHGKIAPINDDWRKSFIYDLSINHNIYSLGRFGTWRNLLLDDVLKDINVLKKLMKNNIKYERAKISVAL
tara:strand:+ start:15425 stop:16330 length:906 start_codon:yes stop_codon:yes gene_type:complete